VKRHPRSHRIASFLRGLAFALTVAAPCVHAIADSARPVRLSKGPYLTGLCESAVDVRFEFSGAVPATIEVGSATDAGGPRIFEDRAVATMHVLHATNLAPATRYPYTVRVGGKAIGGGAFTTAPSQASGAEVKFLLYGDNRSDPTAHAAVVRAMESSSSDFLVNTGDMVEDGGRADDWQSFFDVEAPLLRDRALFVAVGNHELYDDRAGANFARYFGFAAQNGCAQPYGTLRWSNVRFFFLNSMHDWSSGEERQWLEAELTRSDAEPGLAWRIAVTHFGPWSSGPHGGNAALLSAHVPELLAAHSVDLLVAGHDHIYERGASGGLKYVISGGGGAPLYRVSNSAFTRKAESTYHFVEITAGLQGVRLLARRLDGSVLDQCGFAKGTGWDCDAPDIQAPRTPDAGQSRNENQAEGDSALASAPRAAWPPARCGCEALGRPRCAASGTMLLALAALACSRRRGVDRPGFGPVP
jgi:hypothetical protein